MERLHLKNFNMNDWLIHKQINISGYKKTIDKLLLKKSNLKEKSTRGFNSKQYELFHLKDEFAEIIWAIKDEIYKSIGGSYNLKSAWTVLGGENSYHTVHRHNSPRNHVATVLFLDVPRYKNIHQSGNFYYFLQKYGIIEQYNINPKKGTFIMMPIHILHGAYPQAKGLRQTLNLDFECLT